MTDPELVAHKLARIEVLVRELRDVARLDRLRRDVREQRFVEHTLQIAIQCAIDVASHVVAEDSLGNPATNAELFGVLARHGWIPSELAVALGAMAGFRNVLVHQYDEVDLDIVEEAARHRVGDLLAFAAAVRARLPS